MNYNLVEVRKFSGCPYGFCLPIFSRKGSNDAYAQNLDISGRVVEFLPVDTSTFDKIDILPPPHVTDVGLKGFLAFHHEDGQLFVLHLDELREALMGIGIANPFVAVELSALLNDRDLQHLAIRECADVFGNAGIIANWARREKKLFRVVEEALQDISDIYEPEYDALSEDFAKLQSEFSLKDWTEIWIRLWGQGYKRKELVGLASLRLDQDYGFYGDAPKIFLLILDFDDSDFVIKHALKALESSRITDDFWRTLFNRLGNISSRNRKLLTEIASSGLRQELQQNNPSSRVWVSLWSSAFSYEDRAREAWSLAIDYVEKLPTLTSDAAGILVYPFRQYDSEFEPFFRKTRDWVVRYPRSTVVWSTLFLKVVERDKSYDLIDIGVDWLSRSGGNLTSWVNIWSKFHGLIDEELRRDLAMQWLSRARLDMRSWVDIFLLMFENASIAEKEKLKNLGKMWLRSGYGSRASHRKIEQAVRYLESLSAV